jgi:hypothetical protein
MGNLLLLLSNQETRRSANEPIVIPPTEPPTTGSDILNLTLPVPGGVRNTDALIALISTDDAPTLTAPSGWTLEDSIGGTAKSFIYTRISNGNEPATYTWTLDGAQDAAGAIIRVRNVNTQNLINSKVKDSGNGSVVQVPSITTTTDKALLMTLISLNDGVLLDTSTLSQQDRISLWVVNTSGQSVGSVGSSADYKILKKAGTEPAYSLNTVGGSSTDYYSIQIAINPKGSSPPDLSSPTEFQEYAGNPVIDASVVAAAGNNPKEPDCILIGSTYYAALTLWDTYAIPPIADRDVVLASSTDLINWTYVQTLITGAHAATIFEWNSEYHVLYTYQPGATELIGYMHTNDVEGSWTDEGTVLGVASRDPFVVIESGTVYLFYVTGSTIVYRTTTNTDFTGWGSPTTVYTAPVGTFDGEAHSIYKIDGTYYFFIGEKPDRQDDNDTTHNIVYYTSATLTGPYTRQDFVRVKGSAVGWHDHANGHLTFIRSGDIEDTTAPIKVSNQYPILIEGGDGTDFTVGLFYGEQIAARPNYTSKVSSAHDSYDVVTNRYWTEKYINTNGDTTFLALDDLGSLPSGTTTWQVDMDMALGYWDENIAGEGGGFGAWLDSSNWWIVRLEARLNQVQIGKYEAASFSWVDTWAYTINAQTDYKLTVKKTASNTVEVYIDDGLVGTSTSAFYGGNVYELCISVFKASMDAGNVVVS